MLACGGGPLRVPPSVPVAEGAISAEVVRTGRPPINRIHARGYVGIAIVVSGTVVFSGVPLGVVLSAYDAAVDDPAVGWAWCGNDAGRAASSLYNG